MVFSAPIPLRWGDMDAYGHVNNAAFVTYLEQARVAAFDTRDRGTAGTAMLATGLVVVEHQIRYRRQVPYSPVPLRALVWVDEVRSAYYLTSYELWNDAGEQPELAATATTKLAPIDFSTNRPRRFTPEEREFLLSFEPPGGRG